MSSKASSDTQPRSRHDDPTPERILRCLERLAGQQATIRAVTIPRRTLELLESPDQSGIGYSQLNELLLLHGLDRVDRTFFDFLVRDVRSNQKEIPSIAEFERCVDAFVKFGLICFGNTKYAFKKLSKDAEMLERMQRSLAPIADRKFKQRHEMLRELTEIPSDKTYYLGYLIGDEIEQRLRIDEHDEQALKDKKEREALMRVGIENNRTYLASDHLDVYVATSMRKRWDFIEVAEHSRAIFANPKLSDLKLRWFDPTLAYCDDRIDKGLCEALMLKRAKCTLYFAQESETLGKDSELASTLAQGKPVVAYVPRPARDAAERLVKRMRDVCGKSERDTILEQIQRFSPNEAWTNAHVRAWIETPVSDFPSADATKLLQELMTRYYEVRAKGLRESHPLGIQVNLATGVANGVLVARTVDQCAEIIRCILTRTMTFSLGTTESGSITLVEDTSKCVYRVMSADSMLSNAFWNFYKEPPRH
jgi:hypothetical protein